MSKKSNDKGPTSVKVNVSTDNISDAGKEVVRAGQLTTFVHAKEEKVSMSNGAQVYAKLIDESVTPTVTQWRLSPNEERFEGHTRVAMSLPENGFKCGGASNFLRRRRGVGKQQRVSRT